MIPGTNLLDAALTVITGQVVTYYQFTGRATNAIGYDVNTYAAGVALEGSFQPVPRRLYEQYGLDLQKDYATFYAPVNILDVGRDVAGDQIVFNDLRYQCESTNDWYAQDGWVGVLCVLIT